MARLFDEHTVRRVHSLDGAWGFRKDPEDTGIAQGWNQALPIPETVAVPSVWNTKQGELCYEGVAWYEKRFYTEGGTLRFVFGAVMTDATVYLDGEEICRHYGGFCQFDRVVWGVKEGYHTLTVRVDNRFDAQSIPQARVDWYHYGGIVRGVSVETLTGIAILSNRVEYELSEDLSRVTGRVVLELCNASGGEASSALCATLDGEAVGEASVTLAARETREVTLPAFTVADPELWGIGKPALYELILRTDTDDLCDRVGFRKIEVRDNKIYLNGEEIELRGINRHEEHPDWGFAFPLGLMQKDLDLIEEMGCNAVRGSHYPNSQEFVDLLDARGLLFWSEIPIWGWGFSEETLADPAVIGRGLEMHREMVKHYYNHPSIVFWGMHNEIQLATPAAYKMSELYYAYLKERGGNRLVTYACDKPWEDVCFAFCDVISLNQYYGWYYGYEEGAWEKFFEKFTEHKRTLGMEHKPVIVSEFGWAALYGCHDDVGILWSEEYQAAQLSHALEVFHAHPDVIGSFIWQFCDIRTCLEAGINRARGFNNKGILNEYRKPKLAYGAAREKYTSFAKEMQEK